MDEVFDACGLSTGNAATAVGNIEGGDHTPADGFAVQQDFVFRDLFNGVADSMTEVEDHAQAVLAFVFVYYRGFHADGCGDHFFKRLRVTSEDVVSMIFHEAHEGSIPDDSGLDAFHEASAEFAIGKGAENADVSENCSGMMKAANEVFAFGKIDAGLAADRRVDLGEEGCGDLQVADAAHEDGGNEAADVTDDAAAECDEERSAIAAGADHLTKDVSDTFDGLVFFACREEENGGRF